MKIKEKVIVSLITGSLPSDGIKNGLRYNASKYNEFLEVFTDDKWSYIKIILQGTWVTDYILIKGKYLKKNDKFKVKKVTCSTNILYYNNHIICVSEEDTKTVEISKVLT